NAGTTVSAFADVEGALVGVTPDLEHRVQVVAVFELKNKWFLKTFCVSFPLPAYKSSTKVLQK
ncbi:MAG: hypothetical protein AAFO91_12675, partial [Bacteroidota bacterium]